MGMKKKTKKLKEQVIHGINDDDWDKENWQQLKGQWSHQQTIISISQESGDTKDPDSNNQGHKIEKNSTLWKKTAKGGWRENCTNCKFFRNTYDL